MSERLPHEDGRWPLSPNLVATWEPRAGGRPPSEPANPDFPNGMDVDITNGERSCVAALPLVNNRLGLYIVRCELCGMSCALTVAGRADDALLARIPCKIVETAQ